MCKKLSNIVEKSEINFSKVARIIAACFVLLVLIIAGLNTWRYKTINPENETKDTNVYLNEEICYAGGIYIKANSISVTTLDEQQFSKDDDGDELSEFTLNLGLSIERRGGNLWTNTVKLKSQYFALKSVNLKAKSKMRIFFEALAHETISAAVGVAVGGSVNIIEETMNYIGEYTMESIEDAEENPVSFKPIKCEKNQFKPFSPKKDHEPYLINISFPIKRDYLESENIVVLAIDQITHFEQRIFLVTRPNNV